MFACLHDPTAILPPLRQCAAAFSPTWEESDAHTLILPVAGLRRLHGDWPQIAERLREQAAQLGLQPHIAIAATPVAARIAAQAHGGTTIIPPGHEAAHLAALPIARLGLSPEVESMLHAWGVRDFGTLAALPDQALVERLGQEGWRLQRRARGQAEAPLVPAAEEHIFRQHLDLDDPIALLEPLAFVLSRLLQSVCEQLEQHALAAQALTVLLLLENGREHSRTIRLPSASRDRPSLLKLLTLDLSAHPPQGAILSVTLTAEPAQPRTIQQGLFVPAAPQPEKLEITLQRLAGLVGAGNIGTPDLLDTRRPDGFVLQPFTTGRKAEPEADEPETTIVLRLFRPPLCATVESEAGRPRRVQAIGVAGRVVVAAGPWRTSGEWWADTAWDRDEWDVLLQRDGSAEEGLYRLIRLASREWFVDGYYD